MFPVAEEHESALKAWVASLPASHMVYPPEMHNRAKYLFWKAYTPYHPLVRDAVLRFPFVHREGRQDYLLGTIAPGQSMREFISYCVERGYGNHFVAWHDEGQVVSLRYVEDFVYQYHLRVFEDGEVRGHYEYTPECYPLSHLLDVGMEDRRDVFYQHLGDRVRPLR